MHTSMKRRNGIFAAERGRTWLPAFVTLLALLCLKAPDALVHAQFWAEDASVFFATEWEQQGTHFFKPYAGYLHLIPRLMAWLLSSVPPIWAPLAYNTIAILVSALALSYVAARLPPDMHWGWVAIAVAVIPSAGDIYGSLTNVQWFLQLVLVFSSFKLQSGRSHRPESTGVSVVARQLVLLLIALTGPFSLLWVLVLLAYCAALLCRLGMAGSHAFFAIVERSNLQAIVLGACIQAAVMSTQVVATPESASSLARPDYWSLVQWLPQTRHPYVRIVGVPWSPTHLAMLTVYGAVLFWAMRNAMRQAMDATIVFSLLVFFGCLQPLLAFAKQHAPHTLTAASHYYFATAVATVLILGRAAQQRGLGRRTAAAMLAAAAVMLVMRPDYVRRAPLLDLRWPQWVMQLESGRACTVIPVNPPTWHARVAAKNSGGTC